MSENRSEGLVVRAEPIELAEQICERLLTEVRVMDGSVLWLGAEPEWAGAINTVLVKKGVRVGKLCAARKDTLPV
jgi:hypothetical protein